MKSVGPQNNGQIFVQGDCFLYLFIRIFSCLFCPQTKPSKEESLEHMRYQHGFTIPDKQYLEDEDGLLKYLGNFFFFFNL